MAKFDIIAATGCPTGIAHTFMAKEALEKAAAERGLTIKVETHARSVSRTSSPRVRSLVLRPSSSQPTRMSRLSVSPASPWFPLVFPRPCPLRPPVS